MKIFAVIPVSIWYSWVLLIRRIRNGKEKQDFQEAAAGVGEYVETCAATLGWILQIGFLLLSITIITKLI